MCLMYAVIYSHGVFFALGCVTHALPREKRTLVPPGSISNLRWWCYINKRLTALMFVCMLLRLPIACPRKPLSKRFNNTLHIVPNLSTTVLQLLNPTYATNNHLVHSHCYCDGLCNMGLCFYLSSRPLLKLLRAYLCPSNHPGPRFQRRLGDGYCRQAVAGTVATPLIRAREGGPKIASVVGHGASDAMA